MVFNRRFSLNKLYRISNSSNNIIKSNYRYRENFKNKFSFDKRFNESKNILKKYPDRIPVIVEKNQNNNINDIDKNKYLVPNDLTVGQFIYVIRKRIKLSPEKAIFIFVGDNVLPANTSLMSTIYDFYKDEDGFLYITYSGENTFG